jgi:hypothetical protein
MDETGKSLEKTHNDLHRNVALLPDGVRIKNALYHAIYYQGASMLFHKSFIPVALPVPEGVGVHDVWFFFASCANHSFVYTDIIITHYRQHGKNASGTKINQRSVVEKFMTLFRSIPQKKARVGERYFHCRALLERLPDMDAEIRNLILEAKDFYENKQHFTYRIRHIRFWLSHYTLMYGISGSYSKPLLILRLLKYIVYPEKQIS